MDQFLREHHVNTLSGVANTIFPQGLLDRHGADGLYAAYNKVLPRMKQMTHNWGRYFERMTVWKKVKGKDVIKIRCDSQALANLFSPFFHRHTLIPSLYQLGTQEIKPSLNFEGEQR